MRAEDVRIELKSGHRSTPSPLGPFRRGRRATAASGRSKSRAPCGWSAGHTSRHH